MLFKSTENSFRNVLFYITENLLKNHLKESRSKECLISSYSILSHSQFQYFLVPLLGSGWSILGKNENGKILSRVKNAWR
jgi:hypothetical protein